MKTRMHYLLASAFPLAASLMSFSPAMAQTAADATVSANPPVGQKRGTPSAPVPAPAPGGAQVSEVVVTALKQTATVQKTPAAITAVTSDVLEKIGASNLIGIQEVTPALQIAPIRTQALIYLRGVGTTLTAPNGDPSVAVNLNGAYLPSEITGTGFFDLDRVEVLPGPQGTLYGRNSAGGVINLISKRPGSEFETDGFVEVGNYRRLQAQIGVDLPVTPDFALRGVVSWISHEGYDSDGGDDQDTKAVRLTGVWKPTDHTKVTGIVTYSKDSGIGPLGFNIPASDGGYRNIALDPRAQGFFIDNRSFTSSLQVDQDLGSHFSLTYIGGYDNLYQNNNTASWTGPPFADLHAVQLNDTLTQELRLNGSFDKLSTITGLYYYHSRSYYIGDVNNQGVIGNNGPWKAKSEGYAAFTQVTYSLLDTLRLTAGGRFSITDKSLVGNNASGTATALKYLYYSGTNDLNHADWKVGVEYDLAPRNLLYANIATGFTPGGLSSAPLSATSTVAMPFSPVYLTAYTAGSKNRFFDNRLTVNVEGFYYDYKNYQVSARNPVTSQNIVYNAPKARVYGVQVDSHLRITDDDDLGIGVSAQKAYAITLVTPACNCDGYQLPFAPETTWIGSYQHTFHLGNLGLIEALANGELISSRWGLYSHTTGTFVPATHTLDLTATYRPAQSRLSFALWMRNVTNSVIPTYVGTAPAPAGPGTEYLAPPRTYGMRLDFKY